MANEENLTPWKPGESGNPAGKPPGRKNLATIIRELEREDFDWTVIPKHGKKLQEQYGHLGSPFKMIVLVATLQSLRGSKEAREWLRKAGYGDKIDVTTDGKPIQTPAIVSTILPRNANDQTETTESH